MGRFLEHSRIYRFGDGDEPEFWIGSADMMDRNLDRRFEALVQIRDPDARQRLIDLLALALRDNASVWGLNSEGEWTRMHPTDGEPRIELQTELMHHARQRA